MTYFTTVQFSTTSTSISTSEVSEIHAVHFFELPANFQKTDGTLTLTTTPIETLTIEATLSTTTTETDTVYEYDPSYVTYTETQVATLDLPIYGGTSTERDTRIIPVTTTTTTELDVSTTTTTTATSIVTILPCNGCSSTTPCIDAANGANVLYNVYCGTRCSVGNDFLSSVTPGLTFDQCLRQCSAVGSYNCAAFNYYAIESLCVFVHPGFQFAVGSFADCTLVQPVLS